MKHKHLTFVLAVLMSMAASVTSAYDFEVDGIYYNITSSTSPYTVAVTYTYRGNNVNSYSNKYTGSVTIPESVTYNSTTYNVVSIDSYAFYGCSGLTSVTIPNSVTSIGSSAFEYCSGLTSITIPNSVTSIVGSAFSGCRGLTSITIPNSVTSISNGVFNDCTGLKNLVIEDGDSQLSLGYNSSSGLGEGLFYDCPLETLYLGRNISYKIDSQHYSPFYDKTKLTSVTIGNSVTSIGNYSFNGCTGLTSVTIGNNVTSIGYRAFYGCSSLTSVYNTHVFAYLNRQYKGTYKIPDGIKSISAYAFEYCRYLTSVTIPNSVTSIGYSAFYGCSSLTSVTIPNSVTSIGRYAFVYCSGLTSVTIGNSVTRIENETFNHCTGLKNLVFEDGDSQLSLGYYEYESYSRIGKGLFYDCPLETLYLGRNISYDKGPQYGYSPFYGRSTLSSVTIGNSVTSIGGSAFADCSGLKSVTIGTGVLSIALDAFSRPAKVIWLTNTPPKDYTYAAGRVNYVANDQYTSLTFKTVYKYLSSMFEVGGVKYVPVSPSEKTCDAIDCNYDGSTENINIGSTVSFKGVSMTVKDIHPYALYGNTATKNLQVGNQGNIGDYAFYGCTGLTSVTMKNGISTIGPSAFSGCSELPNISIPNSVKSIGANAFQNCKNISTAKIGTGTTAIDEYTFSSCSNLTSIQIGSNVQKIGKGAFNGCSSLPTITIPKAVTSIGDYAFQGCKKLEKVIMEEKASEITLGSNGSYPLFSDCPLDSVFIGRNITYPTSSSKGYSPFYRNTSLKRIHIANVETEVSVNEFYGCTNLKNVRLGDAISSIGDWAFSGCSSLDYFQIGARTRKIGKEAFSDCTAMTRFISRAATPPTCGSQALDDINKWSCTLTVPKGKTSAYKDAVQWKEFFFMNEGDAAVVLDEKVNVTLSASGYATYYNSLDSYSLPSELIAKVVTGIEGNKIIYKTIADGAQSNNVVPAGVAVMLESKTRQGGTYTLTLSVSDVVYAGTNQLEGSDVATSVQPMDGEYVYKLSYGPSNSEYSNVFGWYWGAANGGAFDIKAHKAWLTLKKTNAVKAYIFDDEITGIEDLGNETPEKQTIYDLQGRKVDHLNRKGIFIVNGKKIVRK